VSTSAPAPDTPASITAPVEQRHHDRIGPRRLLGMPGFRRLVLSRFAAQWGDGLFQTALAGAVVFNPEREANPMAIAAGFAVLLLPYSIIGPFAGALLDRWDRRRVLVSANLLRGVLIGLTAIAVAAGVSGTVLMMLALIAVGISRFVQSGLSAALPHVVPTRILVEANAFAVTFGAIMALLGGVCAVALRGVFGEGNIGSGAATAVGVVGSLLAAGIAARFARGVLGPDEVDEPPVAMQAVARGLLDGGRAALRAPTVTAGFVALIAHRAAVGISFLITVLLMRYTFTDSGFLKGGMTGLGQVFIAGGLGLLLAGAITARLVARFGRRRMVCAALVLAAVTQAGLGLPMTLPSVLLATFSIIFAGQVVKLCVDAAVQRDIGDETRGRVFALYDTLFNITQVVAVGVAAAVVPLSGQSSSMIIVATLLYLVGLVGFVAVSRRAA
jgi:MFS family permease